MASGTITATGPTASHAYPWRDPGGLIVELGTFTGDIRLERQSTGSTDWYPVAADNTGAPAKWTSSPGAFMIMDPAGNGAYRFNVVTLTTGTPKWRIGSA
jgi:hypothetical protein